jgi:hypothetical protein
MIKEAIKETFLIALGLLGSAILGGALSLLIFYIIEALGQVAQRIF